MRFWLSRGFARGVLASVAAIILAVPALSNDQVAEAATRSDLLVVADAKPVPAPQPATAALMARTRFIVGLDRKAEYQVFSLANPNRVVVELPDVKLQLPEQSGDASVGLVKSFRGGMAAPGKTRVVIDVTQPVVVESAKLEKDKSGAWRLALDILPVDAAIKGAAKKGLSPAPLGLGASGLQPPTPKRAESPKQRAAKAFKPIIVLDPGHGGMDSGATKFGTVEKDVVLAFAHVLREQLEATGRYKVLMTRDKDIFIELDERLAFGERNKANLFIAVHADYAGTKARGATIFSLRDGVAKDLQRSATNHAGDKVMSEKDINTIKQSSGDVDTVRDILTDLAERDVKLTKERTSVFAKTVIEEMGESTPMRHDPDQQAAFRVLKTAQFPAVLIELGYVSNRQDSNNLKSREWRENVADSITSAVDNYFGNQLARLPM
ncbi:MAG: N-acetylmuramoyl-L-alanine amidase [Hyphomicrobium sp.]|nr:N-acetylmuramoyl-L-alanine amidase [Hyphomicrobium sp.]